jgi:hypothetical protein
LRAAFVVRFKHEAAPIIARHGQPDGTVDADEASP